MINSKKTSRPRGRPRAFDRGKALAAAGKTFWRLGYEGASIADLTAAMKITPQSLYAAFGSKATLYREALTWYQKEIGDFITRALAEEASAIDAFMRILRESAHEFCRSGRPHGCMISTAILTCAVENKPVANYVASLRDATLAALRVRIERAIGEGELPPETDAAALARYLGAMIQGMSVQAQDGASEAELLAMAQIACRELNRQSAVSR